MFFNRFGFTRATAAALALACAAVPAFAQDPVNPAGERMPEPTETTPDRPTFSVVLGFDVWSHFISYGLDVWGGGGDNSLPFESQSTAFGYATVTAAITPEFGAYINVWSDINNNVDSAIGGSLQEVDLNVGVTYKLDKLLFDVAVGQWMYASDVEGILDASVSYDDKGLYESFLNADFALNPKFTVHYRFDPNGGQEDDAAAFVFGIKPTYSYTFESAPDYPISLAFPIQVAFFTDEFQGGDSGYGYFTAGVTGTVPLAFIPTKYGAWTASAGAYYYNTDEDAIPGNPQDNFLVTSASINVAF